MDAGERGYPTEAVAIAMTVTTADSQRVVQGRGSWGRKEAMNFRGEGNGRDIDRA